MTLYGRIISIEYKGVLDWRLTIDGHAKKFKTFNQIYSYLLYVLENAKDKDKKKLLRKDMRCLMQKQ